MRKYNENSHLAYNAAKPKFTQIQRDVWYELVKLGPSTHLQLEVVCHEKYHHKPSTVRTRISELKRMGYAKVIDSVVVDGSRREVVMATLHRPPDVQKNLFDNKKGEMQQWEFMKKKKRKSSEGHTSGYRNRNRCS